MATSRRAARPTRLNAVRQRTACGCRWGYGGLWPRPGQHRAWPSTTGTQPTASQLQQAGATPEEADEAESYGQSEESQDSGDDSGSDDSGDDDGGDDGGGDGGD